MPIIRQDSLFDMQILFDLEPPQRFNSILSGVDIHRISDVVMKKYRLGPKQSLNYSAMIYWLIIRTSEHIPFIKDLVKRLSTDLRFKVLCQEVYKKITDNLRRCTAPARGSMKWDEIYKERSSVERVNAYLKGYFLLDQIYHCTGEKAKFHFDLVHIAYNASKLAVDRFIQLQLSTRA